VKNLNTVLWIQALAVLGGRTIRGSIWLHSKSRSAAGSRRLYQLLMARP
jgi:hypothetical protein